MSHEPNQKVRDALFAWGNISNLIRRKEREIHGYLERMNDAIEVQINLKSQWGSFMPGGSAASGSTVEWAIEQAQEREAQYKRRMQELQQDIVRAMEFQKAVDSVIEGSLDEKEQRVVELRYLRKHSWRFIGTMEGCDESWARTTERMAIKKLLGTPVFSRFLPFR